MGVKNEVAKNRRPEVPTVVQPSSLSSPLRETDRVAFPSVTPPYGVYVMRETRNGGFYYEVKQKI